MMMTPQFQLSIWLLSSIQMWLYTRELHDGDKKSSPFPPRTRYSVPITVATVGNATEIVTITAVTAVLPRWSMLISKQLSPLPSLPR